MDGLRFTTSGRSGWNNILFCALLYLSTQMVPVIGLIVLQGYFAEVHRRLVLRHPEPYVRFDFSDVGNYLSRGVAPFVATLLVAFSFAFVGGAIAIALFVAVAIGDAAGGGSELVALLNVAVLVAGGLLAIPLFAFWITLMNAAVTRAELVLDVGKALRLGEIWAYAGKTWKRALVTGLVLWMLWLGLLLVGLIACIFGIFVTLAIGLIAQLHVRWQIYNEYLSEGGEPIELAPWELLPSEIPKAPQYPPPNQYGR